MDEISILSYFFDPDEEIIIRVVYPIHLYSFTTFKLQAPIRPFLLKNPKVSFYCLLMLQLAQKLLSAQIIKM
jgi:hypothetical protein